MEVNRFEYWMVSPDLVVGSEIKNKTQYDCSLYKAKYTLAIVNIIIMTTTMQNYSTRVVSNFKGKSGQLAIDKVKTMDKCRLQKGLGTKIAPTAYKCIDVLLQYFQL